MLLAYRPWRGQYESLSAAGTWNQVSSGIVPYGYRLADDRTLQEEPSEQRALVLIRHMHKSRLSTRRIGKQLVQLGHQPRTGTHWHPKVVMGLARRLRIRRRTYFFRRLSRIPAPTAVEALRAYNPVTSVLRASSITPRLN